MARASGTVSIVSSAYTKIADAGQAFSFCTMKDTIFVVYAGSLPAAGAVGEEIAPGTPYGSATLSTGTNAYAKCHGTAGVSLAVSVE